MSVQPDAGSIAEPKPAVKRKPRRPYFARLDPGKYPEQQIASRIVQYVSAESDEDGRVGYMKMYHSLHGNRYRNVRGRDLWVGGVEVFGSISVS
jgi:hypothetical protein